jgi:hypothetical protein
MAKTERKIYPVLKFREAQTPIASKYMKYKLVIERPRWVI